MEKKKGQMRRKAWGSLAEVTRAIDHILKVQMPSARREERGANVSDHLRDVFQTGSYPNPITDEIMDQAIAYARNAMGESPWTQPSLIVDPRPEKK